LKKVLALKDEHSSRISGPEKYHIEMKTLLIFFFMMSIAPCFSQLEKTKKLNFKKSEQKLTIGYNQNIETLALLYNLSTTGDYHFNQIPGPRESLSRELTGQYEKFKYHEAVVKLNALLDEEFVDMYDILLGEYNTELPEFNQFADYPAIYYETEGFTKDEIQSRFNDFNTSVISFYKATHLKDHFKRKHKKLYEKIMSEVASVAPNETFIDAAENYFGIQRSQYEIIVSAFSFNGIGRAILLKNDSISKAVCLVTSNHLIESDTIDLKKLNSFVIGYQDKNYFREIGTHELIHTFLHETFKENEEVINQINTLEYLFTDSL
jgi:hypothetical protein